MSRFAARMQNQMAMTAKAQMRKRMRKMVIAPVMVVVSVLCGVDSVLVFVILETQVAAVRGGFVWLDGLATFWSVLRYFEFLVDAV